MPGCGLVLSCVWTASEALNDRPEKSRAYFAVGGRRIMKLNSLAASEECGQVAEAC